MTGTTFFVYVLHYIVACVVFERLRSAGAPGAVLLLVALGVLALFWLRRRAGARS